MHPFTIDHRQGTAAQIDLSHLLERPAGQGGFVTVREGHLVKPDGTRLRLWGVNITDWTRGSTMLPSHADATIYAAALARHGINCVRLHFLDLLTPRGLIDAQRDDTQHFDPDALDRLDYWMAELIRHGIYIDLNLMVGRTYKAGDNVPEHDKIGWAKGISYFDPRLIELQKAYACQILTHRNPYTGLENRHEPGIVIVELVNENSLLDAWIHGRLHPAATNPRDPNFRPLTPYHAELLTRLYNDYLAAQGGETLAHLRALAGVAADAPVPRLLPQEVATAPAARYDHEARFYMEVERTYFQAMQRYLREELNVAALLVGTSDYLHDQCNYAQVWTNTTLDIVDGHVYWQHPGSPEARNTPQVADPGYSTVARLARSAVSGKPYIVSEVNHAFPNDTIAEAIPTLAAYAAFQDWDGVIWYTFEPKHDPDWQGYVGDAFDISLDPVRMPQMAAGALIFLRGDVAPARTVVERTYAQTQIAEAIHRPQGEKPYYTPQIPATLAMRHGLRIGAFDRPTTVTWATDTPLPLVSDTGELVWSAPPDSPGVIRIDTPRTQALIGFTHAQAAPLTNLEAEIENPFCVLVVSSLDGQPIAQATRLLLTVGGRVENSGQIWNAERTGLTARGGPPSLVEPVRGAVYLRHLETAAQVTVQPLDGAGRPLGEPLAARPTAAGWRFAIGDPVTTWYKIEVRHNR